jgi:penicillin-binding protein 2B
VAAPIFKNVSQALRYLGVPKATTKKTSDGKSTVDRPAAPTLTKLAVKDAKQKLLNAGIDFETIGKGTTVTRQYPAAGTPMSPGQRIYLLTEETDKMTVPDVIEKIQCTGAHYIPLIYLLIDGEISLTMC